VESLGIVMSQPRTAVATHLMPFWTGPNSLGRRWLPGGQWLTASVGRRHLRRILIVDSGTQTMFLRRSFLLILGVIIASAAVYYCVCGVWKNCYCQYGEHGARRVSAPAAGHSVSRHFSLPGIG
jgi:hypothetical protein